MLLLSDMHVFPPPVTQKRKKKEKKKKRETTPHLVVQENNLSSRFLPNQCSLYFLCKPSNVGKRIDLLAD